MYAVVNGSQQSSTAMYQPYQERCVLCVRDLAGRHEYVGMYR